MFFYCFQFRFVRTFMTGKKSTHIFLWNVSFKKSKLWFYLRLKLFFFRNGAIKFAQKISGVYPSLCRHIHTYICMSWRESKSWLLRSKLSPKWVGFTLLYDKISFSKQKLSKITNITLGTDWISYLLYNIASIAIWRYERSLPNIVNSSMIKFYIVFNYCKGLFLMFNLRLRKSHEGRFKDVFA